MNRTLLILTILAAAVMLSTVSMAQEKSRDKETPKGFRGEFLAQLGDLEKKVIDLAEATPAEKFGWRPAQGVRSVSEVYMHLAGANYLFASFIGVKSPAGISGDMERTVTEKAKVVENLKQSFEHLRRVAMKTSDADLNKPAQMFGNETTVRGVLFTVALHMHEHLGQSIAYARMNGIVPPWTAARQTKEPQDKKE
jgi:uncharacterized damage-inducible protein DinB